MYGGVDGDIMNGGIGNDLIYGGDNIVGPDPLNPLLTVLDPEQAVNAGAVLDDAIKGGDGNDIIYGGGGFDSIEGNGGHDILIPGSGGTAAAVNALAREVMDGNEGDDIYIVERDIDFPNMDFNDTGLTFLELVNKGPGFRQGNGLGIDEVRFTQNTAADIVIGVTAPNGAVQAFLGIERLVIGTGLGAVADTTGTAAINIDAALANPGLLEGLEIIGNAGTNNLIGTDFNDILDGGVGDDTLIGLLGDDTYIIDNPLDVINEIAAGGLDTVIVQGNFNFSLAVDPDLENLTLLGTALQGTGNDLDNLIIGNASNNVLTGNAGNDTLDGGLGNDTLIGGLGDDTYFVDSTLDVVVEALNEGLDTVNSSVSHTLAANVEVLTLTGTALTGTGNALANTITGNASNNTLNGDAGNDTLTGGLGNDTFVFNSPLAASNVDAITDFVTGDFLQLDRGIFTALSGGTTLTAPEFLAAAGATVATTAQQRIIYNPSSGALRYDSDGTGAAAAVVIANLNPNAPLTAAAIALVGAVPPPPSNVINGTVNADNLVGTAGNDTINGLAGNDTLNGGTGNDVLTGGLGADTFRFDAQGPTNRDLITDFTTAQGDLIALAANVFTRIGNPGNVLGAAQFRSGAGVTTANNRDQRILYDTNTGSLSWDRDGSRTDFAPIQFATLNPIAALTNTSFILV
ncbi:MAG: beta strand repeat-containing protein [Synechocystis sp.]